MHIARVLALLVAARARRRCFEYSATKPWCGPRPLRNGTADAMRALAAAHAWPGIEPGAINVANVAAPGSNAEVGVATAPDGARVVVRVGGAKRNRCRDWAACDAVERAVAAAGCAPKVLFADETARLSEVVEPLRVRKAPDAFGRLVACVHGSGRGVLDRVEPCAEAAARALRARENEPADATERLRRMVSRLLALGRSDLVATTEVLHFDLNDRNVMRRGPASGLLAVDFESVCAGAPALDLVHIFRRHRRATLGPASPRAARTAVVEAYVKARGLPDKPIEDRLWDLEVSNVLGLVLEPHGPVPPGDARSMDFADVLTEILEGAATSPADRKALIEIGVTEHWFRNECAARGAEWVENKCCAHGRRPGRCK